MKYILKNTLIIILIVILLTNNTYPGIYNGLTLFTYKLLPSIFPMLILSDFILSSNIINIISNTIGKVYSKVFNTSKYISYVFIMSMFTGTPSNAKYIKDLLNNNIISVKDAEKAISMCMLYNPILILSITGYLDIKDSIYIIFINILCNIIIGLINRKIDVDIYNSTITPKKFNLTNSISNTINSLLLILGNILFFSIILSLIKYKHPLISGILELTSGINMLNTYNISYKYKMLYTGILLSFSSLSIIYQIKSIFKDTLNLSLFYKSRIIHLILFIIFITLL